MLMVELPVPPVLPEPMDLSNAPEAQVQDAINNLNDCQSKNAKKLCLHNICTKLQHMDIYDIGGSCTNTESDVWFYFSTSICPGYNYLLNLFVCHQKVGNFSVAVSNSHELTHKKKRNDSPGLSFLPESFTWFTFSSGKPNESHFLRTYRFTENDLKSLQNNTLIIPVRIEINAVQSMDNDVIKRIKLKHDFGNLMSKQEKTDFVLKSASKEFNIHKIILAAHSPVLREMIKTSKSNTALIDISDNDMELLVQFLYTGTIRDVLKQDCLKLLEIANRFQLKNLFMLTQYAISEQINVKNAVDIALISEKYNLEKLQTAVFTFIKNNPDVLETDGWKNLNDVNLAKKLFQFMQDRKLRE